jgi:hypothetical protein
VKRSRTKAAHISHDDIGGKISEDGPVVGVLPGHSIDEKPPEDGYGCRHSLRSGIGFDGNTIEIGRALEGDKVRSRTRDMVLILPASMPPDLVSALRKGRSKRQHGIDMAHRRHGADQEFRHYGLP